MKLKKRLVSGLLVFFMTFSIIGCYSYRDINKVIFVTSLIFNENETGDIEVYLDSVKPYRSANDSSDKGKRIIYKGIGKTVLEAIRDVNMFASSKVDFTQCKAYIFTEKAAKNGIRKYMDVINKNQEFLIKPYMFVLFGNPEELLNKVEGDEEYLGVYIDELVQKVDTNPRVIAISANDYLATRTNYNNLMVLGALNINDDIGEKRLELSGGALFKEEKMVRKISTSEAMSYKFLTGKVKSGTLEVINPQNPNTFITLEIANSKTKTSIDYDGKRINLYKDINIKCNIGESQDRLIVDNHIINIICQQESKVIKQFMERTFEEYKADNLDIVNVSKMFKNKYPNDALDKLPITITDLQVNVRITIDGSSITGHTF